jgi:Chaperone of endosialidase
MSTILRASFMAILGLLASLQTAMAVKVYYTTNPFGDVTTNARTGNNGKVYYTTNFFGNVTTNVRTSNNNKVYYITDWFGVVTTNAMGSGHNMSANLRSIIVKGSYNLIESNAIASFIGAGEHNIINTGSVSVFIGGGRYNTASNTSATVGGGMQNTASGEAAAVGGGAYNTASGLYSCIPGGFGATASHNGSFVWGCNYFEPAESFGNNTFTVRCEGGARFYTATGTNIGVSLASAGTSWATLSDSNSKMNFAPIKPREILSKVASMPVTSWHYKHDLSRRYIGPMAQDFHSAFGLGSDDKSISTLDSDGVMYAAIQGLVEELKDRDARIGQLEAKSAEIDQLKNELRAIREQMSKLPPSR